MLSFFIKGFIIGISVALPIGPIALLIIRQGVMHGKLRGIVAALGAAMADMIYALIAGVGLSAVSLFLTSHMRAIRLVGGLFLCLLGTKIFFSRVSPPHVQTKAKHPFSVFTSTFLLTLANPVTLLSFAAIYAGIGLSPGEKGLLGTAALTLGILSGSAFWGSLMAIGASFFSQKMTHRAQVLLNRVSALVLAVFGVAALISLI